MEGTLNGLSLQQTFMNITDSLRNFSLLDEGSTTSSTSTSPNRNGTSLSTSAHGNGTKANSKKTKEKSKDPKPVFWHGLQITPTLIVPKAPAAIPSSSSSSNLSSSSSILRPSSTPPSSAQPESKQNTRSLPATRRPSLENERSFRNHELSRSANGHLPDR